MTGRVQRAARPDVRRTRTPRKPSLVSFRRGRLLVLASALALLVGFATWGSTFLLMSQPAPARSGVQQAADNIRAADAARNKTQVHTLTTLARGTAGQLAAVLSGLDAALPAPGSPAGAVDADKARQWRASTQAAVQSFGSPPSGDTGTNVARQSLSAATDELDIAVRTYGLATEFADPQRTPLLAAAREQLDLAVRTWSVGATELDVVNIQAGYGHQHVYLQSTSGAGTAMTPDGAAQGSTH